MTQPEAKGGESDTLDLDWSQGLGFIRAEGKRSTSFLHKKETQREVFPELVLV